MFQVFRDRAGPSLAPGGSVLCVGAFDGVHRGHQALIAHVRERAAARGLTPLAVSFEPIPRQFFARGAPVPRLASAREKIERVRAAGVARLLLLRFDARLAALSAEAFVDQVLLARCAAREIWLGADFRFGHDRRGDLAMLRDLAARAGFAVELMPDFRLDGERVSSSVIRRQLAAGEFDAAARLLGRRFSIGGRVVHGARLGRELGWPTANLRLGKRCAPTDGIFAVRVHAPAAGGRRALDAWPGVASLGLRPMVGGTEPLLEVHLFDFDGDLYGRRLEVEFVARLREERRFVDLEAMRRQIACDAAAARAILGSQPARRSGSAG